MTDRPKFNEMTGEEAQIWVRAQDGWTDCFMHIHGPECTIISHRFATVRKLRETDPSFKYICGPSVMIPIRWTTANQKIKEDYLWKHTAGWIWEKRRTVELEKEKLT